MRILKTSQNKNIFIDNEDFAILSKWKWHASKTNGGWYAKRFQIINGKQRIIAMHRQLLGLKYGDKLVVDHIDNNGLNNQKNNLRITTNGINIARQTKQKNCLSKYKGVSRDKRRIHQRKSWISQCQLTINGRKKNVFLGSFSTEKEAAIAYDKFIFAQRGQLATLNFSK